MARRTGGNREKRKTGMIFYLYSMGAYIFKPNLTFIFKMKYNSMVIIDRV